jgi:hypothetical protein
VLDGAAEPTAVARAELRTAAGLPIRTTLEGLKKKDLPELTSEGPPSIAAANDGRKLAAGLSITSIEPNRGSYLGITRVTITGTGFSTNFIDGGNRVTIGRMHNGVWVGGDCEVLEGACTVECGSDTKLFCDTPPWDPASSESTGNNRDSERYSLRVYSDCADMSALTGCARMIEWPGVPSTGLSGWLYSIDLYTPTVRTVYPRYVHAGAVVSMAGSYWGGNIRGYRGVYIGRGSPPKGGNIVTQDADSAAKTTTQALCRPEDLNLAANPSTGEVDMASEPVLMEARTPAPIAKDRFSCRVGDFGAGSYYMNVMVNAGLSATDAALAAKEQRDHTSRLYLLQYYPVITSISPTSGSVVGGQEIVVRGGGFSMFEADNVVTIGSLPCRVTYATLEELRCVAGNEAAASELALADGTTANAHAERRRLSEAEAAAPAETIVLAETAAAATGDWRAISNAGAMDGSFLADMGGATIDGGVAKGEGWLVFTPEIVTTAWYKVSVVIPPAEAGCQPRAPTVTVVVTHNGPGASRSTAVTIDADAAARSETGLAFIGEFRFRAQPAGEGVEVTVDTSGTSGCVAVDGLRLEPVVPDGAQQRRGCRNTLAVNFDRLATLDDGSCLFVGGRGIHIERLQQRCAPSAVLTAPSGLISDGRFPVHVTESFGTACEWSIEPPGFGDTWDELHIRVVDFDLQSCQKQGKMPCHNVEIIDATIDYRLARFSGCRYAEHRAWTTVQWGTRAVGGTTGDVCYDDSPYADKSYVRDLITGALPDRVVTVRGARMKVKYNTGPGGAGGARGFVLQYWTTKVSGAAPAPAPAIESLRPVDNAFGPGGECSAAMMTQYTVRTGAGLLWVPATSHVKGLGFDAYTANDCCSLCRRTASCRAWDFLSYQRTHPCRLFYTEGTIASTPNSRASSGLMPLPVPLAVQAAATSTGRARHQLPLLMDVASAAKSPTYIDGIELAETPDDNTAQSLRWRAFFVPPVGGRFRFNVVLKDHGALWASLADADPRNAVRLATGTPTAATVQHTDEFTCAAGEARYVELSALIDARFSGEGSSLLTLTVWPDNATTPSFNTSTINALSTGWFRTVENTLQVAVTTDGLAAACQKGGVGAHASCGFAYKTDRTPTLATLEPAYGTGGTALTITGSNFEPGDGLNTVLIGDVSCAVQSATATQIICVVSHGTGGGRRVVTVNSPLGRAKDPASGKLEFDVTPGIAQVVPAAGSRAGGTRLTLTGVGFDPYGPNNYVKVGARRCEPVVIKNHECRSRVGSPGLPCNALRAHAYSALDTRSYAEWIDFSNATHIECVLEAGASAAETAEIVMVAVADPRTVALGEQMELAAAKAPAVRL